ncbi:hypothetical protein RGQ29_018567 [Quercus rubra]|uniref:Cytochrome P450 n=1 Tax=Quercus rubra TaxID=3512 RepID=A0AAN7J278_QUERU|nr:hypothetical protein RGQ29_018567 [Quercus rubra]
MDFFQIMLHLVVFSISFSLIFLIYKRKSTPAKLPPGKNGWPIIGETLEFAGIGQKGSPEMFIQDRMRKYSQDLFKTSMFGENMAVCCGASGHKFLFSNEKKSVVTWWPRSVDQVALSPESIENFVPEDSIKVRRAIVQYLKPEALQYFIPIMDSMAKEHLEADWSPNKQVKVFPLTMKYTFSLACRLFLSVTNPNHVARLSDIFAPIINDLLCVPVNIPGTAYNRAIKAGHVIRQEFLQVIKQRKKELSENTEKVSRDFLTNTLLALNENRRFMDDMLIATNIMAFIIGGHETTTTTITFVMKYLAEYPQVYSEVFKEQMEIARSKGPNDLLNWDDIKKMKYSWNVACETLRLTPPIAGTFRKAINDFTYAGFNIPKEWKILWSPYSTHKNPEYFPDPEKFDPLRFEGNGTAPYTFVPFGGGPRICPGREYARLDILVFIHNVVTRFKWEKVIPDEKINYKPAPNPAEGLPVYLKSHNHKY